jgi:peptide/nickel transport system substrate-binding protein
MPDSQTRVLALEVGDVDVARLAPTDIARLANARGVTVVSSDTLGFTYYAYQLDPDETTLFQDKAVRQALFLALDRQAMVESILDGQGEIARGTLPPLSPAYRPDAFDAYAYDPNRARDLLAQAGWTDSDGDGVVEKGGQRFSFTMLTRGESASRTSLAVYMQDAWADIGVAMRVEQLELGTIINRIDARDFEMVLLGGEWTVDPGQGRMFATGAGGNVFGYSNPEYDRLDVEQRRTLDPEKRIDLIIEQAQIVWDELPVGMLAFGRQVVGHNERLRNIIPNAFVGLMWSAPFWYLEG